MGARSHWATPPPCKGPNFPASGRSGPHSTVSREVPTAPQLNRPQAQMDPPTCLWEPACQQSPGVFYEKSLDFISWLNSYISGNTTSLVGEEPRLLRHVRQKCLAAIFHRTSLHPSWGWTMVGSKGAFLEDDPLGGHSPRSVSTVSSQPPPARRGRTPL